MTVNFNRNKEALLTAWQDVLNDKTSTDWALFGYEGLSNDLKLVSKGSNGIEELVEDFNSGKIMYAFLKLKDPKTSLWKHVLINWQGEGAPNVRKGTCANHVRDVANFFKGAHLTLNARTEEEVDPAIIIDKLAKSSASVYKFDERTEPSNDSGPVGTTYKRTIPKQEINAIERDRFWEQQEEEEKQRQNNERQRVNEERRKAEAERVLRDSQETARREAQILEASKHINQIRLAEKESFERSQTYPAAQTPVEDLEKEELERRNRADQLKRQRSEEAQSLIAKRTVDARAVFEKNTAAGQLNQRRSSGQPRATANEPTKIDNKSNVITQPIVHALDRKVTNGASSADSYIEPSKSVLDKSDDIADTCVNGNGHLGVDDETQEWEGDVKHEVPITHAPAQFQDIQPTNHQPSGGAGLSATALYDYQAADETEINFDPGDIITHIDQIDEGWWQGLGPDGAYGLFPANYVELIK